MTDKIREAFEKTPRNPNDAKLAYDFEYFKLEYQAALSSLEQVATKIDTNQFDCFQVSVDDAKKLRELPGGEHLYMIKDSKEVSNELRI